jgi:hypothetical protein
VRLRGQPWVDIKHVDANEITITEMTDEKIKKYQDKVDENIRIHGYHMTFVFADESPSFCYSTGIYKTFNIPEIFISSLPQNLPFGLIESYVSKFKDTKSVPVDIRVDDLTDRFPVYLVQVPTGKLTDYVLSSIRFYRNEDYKYLHLIYPDTKGHFPNDVGYEYDQIVLGQFKKSDSDK